MDTSSVLLVALITTAIGFLIGLLTMSLVGNRTNQTKNESDLKSQADQSDPTSPTSRHLLVSVWREPPMGNLRIDMGERTYETSKDLSALERQKLRVIIADLEVWLSGGAPVLFQGPSSYSPTAAGKQTPVLNRPLEEQDEHPSMMAPLSTSLMTAASRAAAVATQASQPKTKSIAAQIDDILQEQIAGTQLEKRGVRLMEIPDHGVTVFVDKHQYQGIDEVPDNDVRSAIKNAVQIWENKTK